MTAAVWQDLARSAILVLDDEPGVREVVARCLEAEGWHVLRAADLGEARAHLAERHVLLALLDVTLPDGESGLDLLAELRASQPPVDAVMLTATAEADVAIEALRLGAWDFLAKPFALDVLRATVHRAVEQVRLAEKARLLDQLETRRQADEENLQQVLVSMATIIDAKSRFTARHGTRVAELARLLAEALGWSRERCNLVALGGRLHDIGKIGTPDAILDKPGPLTREEYDVMKQHPAVGEELVAPIRSMALLRPMIRWHHESLDGRGYPDGLTAKEVPEEAWVVKVADYWEAITARRPYRDPMPLELAARTLRAEAGVRIPGEFVETFLGAIQGVPVAMPAVG
jgi:putative two-component system response regulator